MTGELMALSASLIGLTGVILAATATRKLKSLEDRLRRLERSAGRETHD